MHGYKWPINCTRTRNIAEDTAMDEADAEAMRILCRAAGLQPTVENLANISRGMTEMTLYK